ncbi:MAG: DUF2284 domain-containing protein [Anaerovibrio sp.]|uniref:DUF2284 domain-containing protein n=1 Tax=Anaerovibrio sp. TaxID=1872532 RepID=UPI0025DA9E0E|nr:DUF2284 domain-containing protein [Anaerovibrio sp.]MCR5176457.1 DUF2284 domain-containing protein [Anaerovibrio sp.]
MTDFNVETYIKHLSMQEMTQKYQDIEKHLGYCQHCPRYGKIWSCPPLDIDVQVFLDRYDWIYLVCSKIIIDSDMVQKKDTPEKISAVGWDIMSAVKLDVDEKLRKLEGKSPGSLSLSATACNLCDECTRQDGGLCRYPEKSRYAIDAFGFSVVDITKVLFGIDILWSSDHLPEYYTLVHGFLTKDEVPDNLWRGIKMG